MNSSVEYELVGHNWFDPLRVTHLGCGHQVTQHVIFIVPPLSQSPFFLRPSSFPSHISPSFHVCSCLAHPNWLDKAIRCSASWTTPFYCATISVRGRSPHWNPEYFISENMPPPCIHVSAASSLPSGHFSSWLHRLVLHPPDNTLLLDSGVSSSFLCYNTLSFTHLAHPSRDHRSARIVSLKSISTHRQRLRRLVQPSSSGPNHELSVYDFTTA